MTKATPESSDSLVFECDFEEPPEKVWRALTEPRLLQAWLTAPSRTGPTEEAGRAREAREHDSAREPDSAREAGPSKAQLSTSRPRPQPGDYEVLTAEPHRFVRYRWCDRERDHENGIGHPADREVHSIVTVELAPGAAGGTHLRLTHGEFKVVSIAPPVTVARVRSITSARRRTRLSFFAGQASWRRAA